MNWSIHPLKEAAQVIRGVSFNKTEGNAQRAEGMLPVLRAGNIQSELITDTGLIWVPEGKVSAQQVIRKEDIIMCTSSGSPSIVGKCAKASHDWLGSFGAFCVGIRTNRDICDPSFLYHFLSSPAFTKWASMSSGANIKNIRKSELEGFQIPLPPMEEQKRIAAILDKADAILKKRKQAIGLTEQFLRSAFLNMFGDPITNPKGWSVAKLGDICKKITDGTHHSPTIQVDGVPYITAKHLKPSGLTFEDSPWYVSEEAHREIYKRCDPKLGDVLYIKDGVTTGIAAVNRYDFEFSMLSSLALLRPNPDICTSEYLCEWLNNPAVKSKYLGGMAGAAIRRLTLAKIKQLEILLPPIGLQKSFSEVVNATRSHREKLRAAEQESTTLFFSLTQKYLSR